MHDIPMKVYTDLRPITLCVSVLQPMQKLILNLKSLSSEISQNDTKVLPPPSQQYKQK